MTFTVGPFLGTTVTTGSLTSTTPIPISSGGTGLGSIGTSGQVLTSNGTTLTWATPGSVSSVGITVPSFLSVTGPVTTSGTIAITGTSTGTGSVVLANSPSLTTPTLGAAIATSLLTGSLTITTPLTPSSGGTGLSTVGTEGQVLTSNGTTLSWSNPSTGSVSSVALSVPSFLTVTGSPITSSGTIAITGTSTGTGSVVLSNSPTLVTPTLGTASATSITTGSLTSTTPIPVTSGGTGSAVATGTGSLVLSSAPTVDSITATGSSSIAFLTITAGIPSTSPTTGSLIVTGGVGVSGMIECGTLQSSGAVVSITLPSNVSIADSTITQITSFTNDAGTTTAYGSSLFTTSASQIKNTSGRTLVCLVSYSVDWSANATGTRQVWIDKNGGSTQYGNTRTTPNTLECTNNGSVIIPLANNDYIDLQVYQNSGTALNIIGVGFITYLQLALLN